MSKVNAVIGLSGFQARSGSFYARRERSVELGLPDQFTPDHIKRMHRDLEILCKVVGEHGDEWMEMQNAVLGYDFNRASEIASKIGLDEHRITRQGGGLNWVVVGIAIACAVLLSSDSGPSSGSGGQGGGESGGEGGKDAGNDGPPPPEPRTTQ
ncbi:hypothetical protein [Paraburkholderia sp. HD33-4]|uniref:hypothetical protein n=1 Tax=Paraburkholderia sp. HD33-4 TaxID=2883242 RepID=UPI001F371181|nr:hypothetical protein [Paraburkholderia sp. HD33-4]